MGEYAPTEGEPSTPGVGVGQVGRKQGFIQTPTNALTVLEDDGASRMLLQRIQWAEHLKDTVHFVNTPKF